MDDFRHSCPEKETTVDQQLADAVVYPVYSADAGELVAAGNGFFAADLQMDQDFTDSGDSILHFQPPVQ